MRRFMVAAGAASLLVLVGCGGGDDTSRQLEDALVRIEQLEAERSTTTRPTTTAVPTSPTATAVSTTTTPVPTTAAATNTTAKLTPTTAGRTGTKQRTDCERNNALFSDPDDDGWGVCTAAPTTTRPPIQLDPAVCSLTPTPEEGIFAKDGAATEGQCLHFWAHIFQFDANTGPCSFLAYYGSSPHRRFYDFGDAIIRVDAAPGVSPDIGRDLVAPSFTCDKLDSIVDGDLVEIWAYNLTTESYTTTMGGSNAYTRFVLVDIEKYGSA